jgi:hypothetical protein
MKYQINRGKTCIESGCNNNAKVKGLCIMCYQKRNKGGICQKFADVFIVEKNLELKSH